MTFELDFARNLWQTVVAVSILIIFILALKRYMEKRSEISKTLVITFGMFSLAMIFQIWGTWGSLYNLWNIGPYKFGDPNFLLNLVLFQISNSQMAYIFLVLGLLFLYRFTFELTKRENDSPKKYRFATLFACLIIFWALIRVQFDLPTGDMLLEFLLMVDPYVVIFCFFMSVPIIHQGFILQRKIPKDDPMFPKIRMMMIMGIFIFIMTLSLILETVWGVTTGEWSNIFSFLGWGFALGGIITAYLSFYKR